MIVSCLFFSNKAPRSYVIDIVIDLGFKVRLDAEDVAAPKQDDGLYFDYTENVMQLQPVTNDSDIIATAASIPKVKVESDEKKEEKEKPLALSSIADNDLREALAPFDADGSGTIDLLKVREAAEGKGPGKLHWSESRPMVGLAEHVKQVNHVAILVSDVSRSLKFYSQVMGFEQIRR